MRISSLIIAGALLGVLGSSSAQAATTSHLEVRGTSVNLSLMVSSPGAQPSCTVDTWIVLMAATSVEHVGGGGVPSSGASGFVQQFDNCAGTYAFGSIDAPLGTGFSAGPHSATLNASIVVAMAQFDPNFNVVGTVNRTLQASNLLFDELQSETFVARSHSHLRGPGYDSIGNGQTHESPASLSGLLTLDGHDVVADPTASFDASFETSSQVSIFISK